MDVIIFIVAIVGSRLGGYDFPALYFYISLPYSLHRCIRSTIRMMKLPMVDKVRGEETCHQQEKHTKEIVRGTK